MIIITQTYEVVNFDNILKVEMTEEKFGDKTSYLLLAVPNEPMHDDIQLGIYESKEECYKFLKAFYRWFEGGEKCIFLP